MKDSPICWLWMLGIVALTPLPLFAQQGAEVKIGMDTKLTLPPGWSAMEANQGSAAQQVDSSLDIKGTKLLLIAKSVDSRPSAVLSVYRTSFPSVGPSPLDDTHGLEAETEKLLCAVLNLGYTPLNISTSNITSERGVRMACVDITAKAHSGDVRVFSEKTTANKVLVLRLSISRARNDEATARDFVDISNSLIINEQLNSVNQKPNSTAGDNEGWPKNESWQKNEGWPKTKKVTYVPSPEAGKLVAEYSEALAIIEGKDATGSGFICKTADGHTYVYTNAHVAASSGGFKMTNLKSAVLEPGASGIAVGHDIVRIEIKNAAKAFEILPDLDSAAKIGDEVLVLGNIRGGMVVKPVEGKIQGIGPNLVEVDAPFEPGNSGSPIIHKASGQVIGIATYLTKRKVDDHRGSVSTDIRRFGYRLDSVKTWEPINWPVFFAQAAAFDKIDGVSNDLIQFCNSGGGSRIDPGRYKSLAMQHVIQNFNSRVKGRSRMGPGEQKTLLDQLLSDLRSAAKNDLVTFDMRTAYDYFRRQMEEQIQFRDAVYNDISKHLDQSVF